MANIFLSHSSVDKPFVRKLANDLKNYGHTPWLDEWEIKVGDCIVSKIESGINKADYVILILSKKAVQSGWVEKEWKSKYWDEVNDKKVMVLPVLIEDCEIPGLIKTKKYADFRKEYSFALEQLIDALPSSGNISDGATRIKESIYTTNSAPKLSILSWSNLCYLDRPPFYWFALSALFIVPIIASINKSYVSATYVESVLIEISLPFAWKIPFFAATLYLISMVIYKLYCPKSITIYRTYSNFSRAISSLIDNPQRQDSDLSGILSSAFGADLSDSVIWNKLNNTKPLSRLVAYILVLMSGTLIINIVLQLVIYVIHA